MKKEIVEREQKIQELTARMTLEEKVSQLTYTSPAIPRLGIPEYNWWNECLHGVARAGLATIFPQAIALAAIFDEDFIQTVATAISDEARAKYNEAVAQNNRGQYWGLTFWTPNINIFRDPRWGRGQETYGEDPYLTSRIGLAFVRGLQGNDPDLRLKTAACAKHFAVHSGPENLRHTFDAQVSKKDLFETYLPAFKTLAENGVEAVMGAYNRTLGEPCCASVYLLQKILRKDWQFKGHVVSDCWAIKDFHENHKVTATPEESAALALNNGCDLNCGCTFPYLTESYKQGLVTEEAITTAVTRLLRTRFKLGMFGDPEKDPYQSLGRAVIHCEKHQQLALEAARKSIVLLKNAGNLLPLDHKPKKILLVGPGAANLHTLLGNYYGISPRLVTILEGLAEKTREKFGINLEYRHGCLQYEGNHPTNVQFGSAADVSAVIAVFGLDGAMEGEEGDAIASDANGDREYIELPPWQIEYLQKLKAAGKPVILVLTGGSPIAFPEDIADAILFAWYPGEQGGTAVADILFGDVTPSGKLPVTFPASTAQLPPYEDYAMRDRTYRYMREKPLYPFGFGLSYTKFRFDAIKTQQERISAGEALTFTVLVSNIGKRDAEEVIQIYVSRDGRTEDEPAVSLKAFRRVFIPKDGTLQSVFVLPVSAFETVTAEGDSVLLPGSYTVCAANAAPLPVALERGAVKPVSMSITIA
ncbi:MAG: glycoside hydrolase family 3 C-terminal domain-containing protein [Spirochaetaceae bacterium]|jgi:beta-glucosidase|nr:glycoside hydrolase family 3 C-terminal domain-containing protein [Spirochaetaceae bacterium]